VKFTLNVPEPAGDQMTLLIGKRCGAHGLRGHTDRFSNAFDLCAPGPKSFLDSF
jgi:hypothetical protein